MLTIISPAIITTALLLCAIGCDNKDYSNASPFDNVVYLDAAKLKDVSNFTFNRTIETGQKEISALFLSCILLKRLKLLKICRNLPLMKL